MSDRVWLLEALHFAMVHDDLRIHQSTCQCVCVSKLEFWQGSVALRECMQYK